MPTCVIRRQEANIRETTDTRLLGHNDLVQEQQQGYDKPGLEPHRIYSLMPRLFYPKQSSFTQELFLFVFSIVIELNSFIMDGIFFCYTFETNMESKDGALLSLTQIQALSASMQEAGRTQYPLR